MLLFRVLTPPRFDCLVHLELIISVIQSSSSLGIDGLDTCGGERAFDRLYQIGCGERLLNRYGSRAERLFGLSDRSLRELPVTNTCGIKFVNEEYQSDNDELLTSKRGSIRS
jgi:hypothetical protein